MFGRTSIVKYVIEQFLLILIRFALFLRYRIKVVGKEKVTTASLAKPGGILFLANHPAEIDPLILIYVLWKPFKPRPVAIEYLFRKPFLRNLLDFIGAIAVPNFDNSSNSYKRKQMDKTYEQIYSCLDRKENLLLYPSGSLQSGGQEILGGASGIFTILKKRPESNIVLIRSTGLWGSIFSRAPTGKTPDLFNAFSKGFKVLLRNFIFFAPRRLVTIELSMPPRDFPWQADKLTLNRYLEKWYNPSGPEPLNLVSFSIFKKEYPSIVEKPLQAEISLENVPEETKQIVFAEIAKLSRTNIDDISIESHLAQDLGLDSLDIAQLVVSLKEQFGINSIQSSDLTTVGSVLALASKLTKTKTEEDAKERKSDIWKKETNRPDPLYPEGNTIIEVFLRTCERMDGSIACVDRIAGHMSYRQLKTGIILLAGVIKQMPGEHIGIMMPASVAVNAMILATMLAGKIPVMINWTLGERNLRSIAEQAKIQITLSSWQFIDRLDNVELGGIDDNIVLLEELRRNFSFIQKLQAFIRAFQKTYSVLKRFGTEKLKPENTAAILFTSGTESYPKGVPLSHYNLLSNQRGAYSLASLQKDKDNVLLGSLPPFHSFGFSVTGLLPLLTGLRVAYSPNPTDGKRIAEAIEHWNVTLLCLAPTFLKNLLRVAADKQLRSLRMVVVGAEKMAQELAEKLSELNPHTILIEGYGITECAPILTLNPPGAPTQGVGIPLPDVEIKVVDPETLNPMLTGEQGLILARGPNVFSGYLDPSLASPFVEFEGALWYQTGDLGYLSSDNYLTLSGRLKRFVKIGGEMVSLTAIEETLLEKGKEKGWDMHPEEPSLAVCALEQDGKKSEIHLFTTFSTTVEEVNQILRESGMSNIIKIRSVTKIAYIPLLGSGKIDYRRLATQKPPTKS